MRIVAGKHRGRALAAPGGVAMRPTADRVREALFSVLEHGIGVSLDGVTVLDIFAGTGAIGLEALSRGAEHAVFVDIAQPSLALIRDNVAALGEGANVQILRRDAARLGAPPAGMAPASLAFFDPPYGENLAPPALIAAGERGWLAPGAICVVETRRDEDFAAPEGFTLLDERTYGGTRLYFLQFFLSSPP